MKFLSRKFLLALIVIICINVALYLNKINGNNFITGLLGVAGFYIGGNVAGNILKSNNGNGGE